MSNGSDRDDPPISRRRFLRSVGLVAVVASGASVLAACGSSEPAEDEATSPVGPTDVVLHRQEGCSCCATYADYLRDNGFSVEMETHDELDPIRERYSVPEDGVGCHTSLLDGYVIEGHVPIEAINRLLSERPDLDGISVVGMPTNSPGMGEPNGESLDVLSIRNGRVAPYMSVTTF